MATTNIWQQFKALLLEGAKTVVTIIANNGNGTSQAKFRDGSVITVKGGSVGVVQKAFVKGGEVIGSAPDLVLYEAQV